MPQDQSPEHAPTKGYGLSVIVALLIIIGLGGWFAYYISNTQPLVDSTLREQFVWVLTPAAPLPAVPGPRITVSLKIADATLPVGTYTGSCEIIDGKKVEFITNELSGVVCRSGSSGTELGIFKDATGALMIEQGAITNADGRGSNFTPVVQETSSTTKAKSDIWPRRVFALSF